MGVGVEEFQVTIGKRPDNVHLPAGIKLNRNILKNLSQNAVEFIKAMSDTRLRKLYINLHCSIE